ncbi:MAG: DUF2384 domain-containing protein [Rhodocyclales bacterium]|nr:DUF2384 domain-containing protein [Rhodocyclales bacterium]
MKTIANAVAAVSKKQQVLTKAVIEASRRLELGSTDIGDVIGTSQPTASRLLNGKKCINERTKEWELAAHFVRLYRSLSSVVGGNDELARAWLKTPNRAFADQVPLDAIKRVEGLLHACEYLDAHRARV